MKRRILKQTLNKISIISGKPVTICRIQYLVQEYNEVADNWNTITYNTDFDTVREAVFSTIEPAKLCYSGKFGVIEEEVIKTDKINLKE